MNSFENSSPRVAQLLGKAPLCANSATYKSVLQGRRVLVTGGGGSIGQELCRRVADCQPAELIILATVFLISVLPTVIWTLIMSKKDSIAG